VKAIEVRITECLMKELQACSFLSRTLSYCRPWDQVLGELLVLTAVENFFCVIRFLSDLILQSAVLQRPRSWLMPVVSFNQVESVQVKFAWDSHRRNCDRVCCLSLQVTLSVKPCSVLFEFEADLSSLWYLG
jgi:hypothetical protein